MGTGTDAAIEAGDLTLVCGDLLSTADAIHRSVPSRSREPSTAESSGAGWIHPANAVIGAGYTGSSHPITGVR